MASWKQFYQSRQVRIRKLVNQFFNIKQEGPVKLEQKINDLDLIEKEIQLMKEQFVKAILEDNNAKQKSASTDMISTGQIKHTYAPSTKLASEVQEKTKQIESRKLLPMYTDWLVFVNKPKASLKKLSSPELTKSIIGGSRSPYNRYHDSGDDVGGHKQKNEII